MVATSDFNRKLADEMEAQFDAEFVERGKQLGVDVLPASELAGNPDARPRATTMAEDGEPAPVSPWANIRRAPQHVPADDRQPGRAPEPVAFERRQEGDRTEQGFSREYRRPRPVAPTYQRDQQRDTPAKPKRKQITVHTESVPIDLIDARTGDSITVYMRSVPTTELPYLDRHDLMLNDIRQRMARIRGNDQKERRRVDQLAADYNAVAEEMTRFVIDMPDGLYETLDVPTLRALQREITAMVQGNAAGGADGDDDPNW